MDDIFEFPVHKYAQVTSFRLSMCLVPKLYILGPFYPLDQNDVTVSVETCFWCKMDDIFEFPVHKYAQVTSFRLSMCLVPKF